MTLTMFHIVSVSLFYGLVPGISVGGTVNENSVCKKENFSDIIGVPIKMETFSGVIAVDML